MMAPVAPAALASHPSSTCVDVEPDRADPVVQGGTVDRLTASVGMSDAGHPPANEGCVVTDGDDFGNANIDFEIIGAGDPDTSDSPDTPDMTCTVPAGSNNCKIAPPEAEGDQTIDAWLDGDGYDTTTELDLDEGADEAAEPGAYEPDLTDVALWTWTTGEPPPDDERFTTRVTIGFEDDTFTGTVQSVKARCVRYRIVTVKRVREGRDEIVARAKASEAGRWRAERRGRITGRFYARVGRYTWTTPSGGNRSCEPDRSSTIRLR